MTEYGRTYTPPIFHTEKADREQLKVMQIVFDTLKNSGVDFCVVKRSKKRKDELIVNSYGNFSLNEKGEILTEIVGMYINDKRINHIEVE